MGGEQHSRIPGFVDKKTHNSVILNYAKKTYSAGDPLYSLLNVFGDEPQVTGTLVSCKLFCAFRSCQFDESHRSYTFRSILAQ